MLIIKMTTQNKTWEIIFYKTKGWDTGIDVKLENETNYYQNEKYLKCLESKKMMV